MIAKNIFGLLSLILILTACEKNTNTGGDEEPMQGWAFQFMVVGSMDQNLFDPLPISYETGNPLPTDHDTLPFDPEKTYFVDGLGKKLLPSFGSHPDLGMTFHLYKDAVSMFDERDAANSNIYKWLVYLDPAKSPDTLIFQNPAIHPPTGNIQLADFITYNSDTLKLTIDTADISSGLFKIHYP